jgi:hypothetical protein
VRSAVGGSLNATEINGDMTLCGGLTQSIQVSGLGLHGLSGVLSENRFLQRRVESSSVSELQPKWIARHERFPEHHQVAPSLRSLPYIALHFLQRPFSVQPDRSDLREPDR